jgi:hypothetical protein
MLTTTTAPTESFSDASEIAPKAGSGPGLAAVTADVSAPSTDDGSAIARPRAPAPGACSGEEDAVLGSGAGEGEAWRSGVCSGDSSSTPMTAAAVDVVAVEGKRVCCCGRGCGCG